MTDLIMGVFIGLVAYKILELLVIPIMYGESIVIDGLYIMVTIAQALAFLFGAILVHVGVLP